MEKQEHHIVMQEVIGNLLRTGVMLAAIVVLVGGILYLMQNSNRLITLHHFKGEPQRLTHISIIFKQALSGHSQAIIQMGLLILIFTPIARVLLSVFVFALEKDRLYVLITLIVLGLLLYSLIGNAAA